MLSHLELRLIGEVMLRNFNASGAQPTTQKFAGDKWEHHLQCNILSYAEFVSVFLQLRGAHPATLRRFRWLAAPSVRWFSVRCMLELEMLLCRLWLLCSLVLPSNGQRACLSLSVAVGVWQA